MPVTCRWLAARKRLASKSRRRQRAAAEPRRWCSTTRIRAFGRREHEAGCGAWCRSSRRRSPPSASSAARDGDRRSRRLAGSTQTRAGQAREAEPRSTRPGDDLGEGGGPPPAARLVRGEAHHGLAECHDVQRVQSRRGCTEPVAPRAHLAEAGFDGDAFGAPLSRPRARGRRASSARPARRQRAGDLLDGGGEGQPAGKRCGSSTTKNAPRRGAAAPARRTWGRSTVPRVAVQRTATAAPPRAERCRPGRSRARRAERSSELLRIGSVVASASTATPSAMARRPRRARSSRSSQDRVSRHVQGRPAPEPSLRETPSAIGVGCPRKGRVPAIAACTILSECVSEADQALARGAGIEADRAAVRLSNRSRPPAVPTPCSACHPAQTPVGVVRERRCQPRSPATCAVAGPLRVTTICGAS